MPYTIESKTILLPQIICETAIWELFEELPQYRKIEASQCGEIVSLLTPSLVDKANRIYAANAEFRKGITSNEKGRDKLAMWFKHWAQRPIKEYFRTHTMRIEQPFN